jgi:hypothetical protein
MTAIILAVRHPPRPAPSEVPPAAQRPAPAVKNVQSRNGSRRGTRSADARARRTTRALRSLAAAHFQFAAECQQRDRRPAGRLTAADAF